jgi:hypothetical protein
MQLCRGVTVFDSEQFDLNLLLAERENYAPLGMQVPRNIEVSPLVRHTSLLIMEGSGRGIILWGLKRQFIPFTGFKFFLGWFESLKTRHTTMQFQGNNQNVIHIVASHADGVWKVSGFQTLKFWWFTHNHTMQSHLHCAEQVVTQGKNENALMDNQEHIFPCFWDILAQSCWYNT